MLLEVYWNRLAKGLFEHPVTCPLGSILPDCEDRARERADGKEAKRLRELEKENARLKKLVAHQALDNSILKEAATGNF